MGLIYLQIQVGFLPMPLFPTSFMCRSKRLCSPLPEQGVLRTVDGLGMLLHQAVPGFERWFGRRPEVTPQLRAMIVTDLGGDA